MSARDAFDASTDAFNRGDYETAFAGLAPDVEWHMGPWVFDSGGVVQGRDAVIELYTEGVADAGDWQITLLDVEDLGGGRVLTHQRGTARGRTSGIELSRESFLLWTIRDDGRVSRMQEFATREEALASVP